ncbi:MAG: helix-turn-helix domain-containing protein [Clostridia bacterium]|nr:helix-turn-helix domain-containing protein [Clostridia bacterium]
MIRLDPDQVHRLLELLEADPQRAAALSTLRTALQDAVRRGAGVQVLAGPNGEDANFVLSPLEVANLYGVSAQIVRRWCAEGKLPGAYKLPGGGWQIPLSALLEATHVPRPGRVAAGALAKIAGLLKDRPQVAQELLEARRGDDDRELPLWTDT